MAGLALAFPDITLERTRPMSFGAFVVTGAGSVVIPPLGGLPQYNRVHAMRGHPEGAVFEISGRPEEAVEVTLPARIEIRSSSARGMLSALTVEARHTRDFTRVADGVYRVRMDGAGRNTLYVGGKLDISGSGDGSDFAADIWLSARSLDAETSQ